MFPYYYFKITKKGLKKKYKKRKILFILRNILDLVIKKLLSKYLQVSLINERREKNESELIFDWLRF